MLLENQWLLGSVNAARQHYEAAVADLPAWRTSLPGPAGRLTTSRQPSATFAAALAKDADGIKSVVEVSPA